MRIAREAARARPGLLLAALVVAAWPAAAGGAAAPGIGAGMPLREALLALQRQGVRVVFSTALVPPELRVLEAPRSTAVGEVLAEILEPHGLALEPGVGRRWLVVPGSPPEGEDEAIDIITTDSIVVRSRRTVLTDVAGGRVLEAGGLSPSRGPMGDLAESVALLPGIAAPDVGAAFHVRGGDAGDSALVVDGLEIGGPFHFTALGGLLGIVDPRVAERVAVLSGAYPAEYGGRLGGLLEVATAEPTEREAEVHLSSTGVRLRGQGRLGAGTGWLAAGRAGELHRRVDLPRSVYQEVEPRYFDTFAKLERRLGGGGVLALNLLASGDDVEARGSAARFGAESRRAYGWLRLEAPWGRWVWGRTVLALGDEESRREGFLLRRSDSVLGPDGTLIDTDDDVRLADRREGEFRELKQDWVYRGLERHSLKGGFRFRREEAEHDYRRDACDPLGAIRGLSGCYPAHDSRRLATGERWEAYVSDRLTITPALAVELGLRWEREPWSTERWSPRLNVVWAIGGGVAYLGAGDFAQPSELADVSVQDLAAVPDPAQRSDQVALGFERSWGDTTLQLEAYRYELRRLAPRGANPLLPRDPLSEAQSDRLLVEPEDGSAQGLEVLVRHRFSRRLDGQLSYSLAEMVERVDDAEVPRSWDQRHALSFDLAWRPHPPWRIDLTGFYHSGWPVTPLLEGVPGREGDARRGNGWFAGELNASRNPSVYRFDLAVGRGFELPHGRLEAELTVTNLLDRDNLCCIGNLETSSPKAKREMVRIESLYWSPRTVEVGLGWRF